MIRSTEVKVLLQPTKSTTTTLTGSYVDLAGLINPGNQEVRLLLLAGVGTTAGTCGGSVQTAQTTAGAGLATLTTFTTLTSAGGSGEKFAVIPASHRYARFVGTIQSTKNMLLSCVLEGVQRDA